MSPDNFDPFLDWDKIDHAQAKKLAKTALHHRRAVDRLIEDPSPENAAKVLRGHHELQQVAQDIEMKIFTVPAMIHIAGPVIEKTDDNGDDIMEQRCARCGSVINQWSSGMMMITAQGPMRLERDEVPWVDEGVTVGKADHGSHIGCYLLNGRVELESHEVECVDLAKAFDADA